MVRTYVRAYVKNKSIRFKKIWFKHHEVIIKGGGSYIDKGRSSISFSDVCMYVWFKHHEVIIKGGGSYIDKK